MLPLLAGEYSKPVDYFVVRNFSGIGLENCAPHLPGIDTLFPYLRKVSLNQSLSLLSCRAVWSQFFNLVQLCLGQCKLTL